MYKTILSILSERTIIDNQEYLKPPKKGIKRKIFNYFSNKLYEKNQRNIPRQKIEELENVLEKTIELFKDKNHLFQIDINQNSWVELQIVHPYMLKENIKNENNNEFGFVVYWTHDSMKELNLELLKRMSEIPELSEYIHFKTQKTIDCFAFNCGNNIVKAYEVTKNILNKICGYEHNEMYRFSISDNGKIITAPNNV